MKKILINPERKLFWRTAGIALLLLVIVLLIALFGWALLQQGELAH